MSGILIKRSLPEDMKCLQDAQKGVEYVHARVVLGGDEAVGIGEGAPADPEGEVNKPGDEERHREQHKAAVGNRLQAGTHTVMRYANTGRGIHVVQGFGEGMARPGVCMQSHT